MAQIIFGHKRIAVGCALLAILHLLPLPALAWGKEGHRIVGDVASRYLSDKAKAGVAELLGNWTLASVANWADNVRNFRPGTAEWHYVNIPLQSDAYNAQRDCAGGNCIIAAIEAQKAILPDRSRPKRERTEALKFIIHFIGDLHQPLHCADDQDRGGNEVIVKFLGKLSKLHAVWDSGIINASSLTEEQIVAELLGGLEHSSKSEISRMQEGSPQAWALESHRLAQTNAYHFPASNGLDETYYGKNIKAVKNQLMRAGLRLARTLNEVFK